jgi:hypothetical protein
LSDPPTPGAAPPATRARIARAVPADHAFAWYREAMRLWRTSPAMFAALAGVAIAAELLLPLIPIGGMIVAQAVLPLIECAMLYASLAADRRDKPRLRHLLAVLGAPPRSLAAIVASSLIAFAAQALAAGALTDLNLLQPEAFSEQISLGDVVLIVGAGVVASLPFSFVAPVALFDDPGFATSFTESVGAFTRNLAPLAIYAGLSLGLFLFGIATSGLGLLLALPWLAASSYAAWKDVFAVGDPPTESAR